MSPAERFSDRAEPYRRYRPGYPGELFSWLREGGLPDQPRAADLGAGTGIGSEFLLRHGCSVTAVEPNDPMRHAAVGWLGAREGFHAVPGYAEQTGLPSAAFDLVAAFQAAHWFDFEPALQEMKRLVRPGGWLLLAWNTRSVARDPFAGAIETLLSLHAPGYHQREARMSRAFQGLASFETKVFDNQQTLDWEAFRGLARSWSYVPPPDHSAHDRLFSEFRRLFDACQKSGKVTLYYDCHAFRQRQ